eukprot:4438662-Prymnesium_polylepis.1
MHSSTHKQAPKVQRVRPPRVQMSAPGLLPPSAFNQQARAVASASGLKTAAATLPSSASRAWRRVLSSAANLGGVYCPSPSATPGRGGGTQ